MVKERGYTNMTDTVQDVINQARDSAKVAHEYMPGYISTPQQLWDYWKPLVTFVEDDDHPLSQYTTDEVELIQHIDTMARYGWIGDCDCFTALIMACCESLGWSCGLVLQGDDREAPSHIYPVVFWNNQEIALDLTEPVYNTTRAYKFSHVIPVTMRVKLADGNMAYIDESALSQEGSTSVFDWANLLVGGASDIFGNIFGTPEAGSTDYAAMTQMQLMQTTQMYEQKLSSARTNQIFFGLGGLVLGGIIVAVIK